MDKKEVIYICIVCVYVYIHIYICIYVSDIERKIPYDFSYMWNLKNKTYEQRKQNRKRLSDRENKLMITRVEGMVK